MTSTLLLVGFAAALLFAIGFLLVLGFRLHWRVPGKPAQPRPLDEIEITAPIDLEDRP